MRKRALGTAVVAMAAASASLSLPREARALDPSKPVGACTIDVWQAKDGLPGNTIRAIRQTSDGYLWVATLGGVGRYDGAEFIELDAPGVSASTLFDLTSLHAARDGSLWIGPSYREPLRFLDGRATDFARRRRGLAVGARAAALTEDAGGTVWLATSEGLFKYRDGKFEPSQAVGAADLPIQALAFDARGRLWLGRRKGLFRVDGDRLSAYAGPHAPVREPIDALHLDRRGHLWVAAGERLLELATGDGGSPEPERASVWTLPAGRIEQIESDRDGNLWLASRRGLVRFHGGAFVAYGKADGLPDDDITAVFEDREGSLWIGTRKGGVAQITDRTLSSAGVPPAFEGAALDSVSEDDEGALWLGTSHGAIRMKDGVTTVFTTEDGLPGTGVYAVQPGVAGEVWIGTTRGLARWRDGKIDTPVPIERSVTSLYRDRRGALWIGTPNEGLARWDGTTLRVFSPRDGLGSGQMRAIGEDAAGRIWASALGALTRQEGDRFVRVARPDGQKLPHARSILGARDGSVWLATQGRGLMRYHPGPPERFDFFGSAQGLPTDLIHQMAEDEAGDFWIGTHVGVARVGRASIDEVAAGRRRLLAVSIFDTTDRRQGVVAARKTQPSVWRLRDGRICFVTDRGLVTVDPRRARTNSTPPPVLVDRVIVDGRAAPAAGPAVKFPPGPGNLEIHYKSLSFVQPKRALHRYRLAGFDRDWIDAGARRVAYYTNMPPGRYRFEVQAANSDGVWNAAGAAWAFAIAPHFYQTWWFYGACACALAGLAWLGHRARLGRIRAVYLAAFAERNRVARELHDTLLQGMNAVAMQLAAVRMRMPPGAEDARRALEGVQGLVTETLQDTRQAVWDLREQPPGDGDLGVALGRLCRRLCGPLSVRHDVRVEGEPFTLPHPVQDEVFRIVQEAVSNALKHAAPARIDLDVRWGAEALVLAVRDDGRGFDPADAAAAPAAGHYGLQGLRERAAAIGGKLEIASGPGRGTTVELVVARRREAAPSAPPSPNPTESHA